MNEHIEELGFELEAELDERPLDMEDEIITLDENGKPVILEVADDTEDVEEPADVEYD